jgi:meso-butanediol dehydrogenase / (S,S)-butanediol dehydrogenase / diacetyl reductase
MNRDFDGLTVFILGGTNGIGRATARLVLQRGGRVVVTGRRAETVACGRFREGA